MPKIQDYGESQVSANAPAIGDFSNPGAAGMQGRFIEGVGEQVSSIGQAYAHRKAQEEVSNLNADLSNARAEFTSKITQDTQDGTLDAQAIKDQYQKQVDKISEGVETGPGRNYFNRQSARLGSELTKSAVGSQARLAGLKAVANFTSALNNNSSAIQQNPQSFQDVYDSTMHDIDAQVETGGLPAAKSEELKLKSGTELAKNAVRGWAQLDPASARELLNRGDFDKYMNGDVKAEMNGYINQQEKAKEIEDRRAEKAVKDAQKLQGEAWEDKALPSLTKGSLKTQDILNSPMSPEKKIQWLHLAEQATKEKTQGDPRVKNELTRRILLPEGDPQKITDISQMSSFVGKGISVNDVGQLNSFLQKTPEGQALSQNRKLLIDQAKATLVKKDVMNPFMTDADSEYNLASYQVALQNKEAQFRKDKKPIASLYDPNSPDYFGNEVGKYKLTPEQVLAKKAGIVKSQAVPTTDAAPLDSTAPPPPVDSKKRLPKETADSYLKRQGFVK